MARPDSARSGAARNPIVDPTMIPGQLLRYFLITVSFFLFWPKVLLVIIDRLNANLNGTKKYFGMIFIRYAESNNLKK